MNQTNPNNEPIDPRLEAMLDNFKPTPPRDPQAAARGRANFMADVDALVAEQPPRTAFAGMLAWLGLGRGARAGFAPRQAAVTWMASLAVIVVLIFGGGAVTAYAAQDALPGDALYGVKTNLESARVRLARDAAAQAELHLEFAGRRLEEIAGLIHAGRYNDIGEATRDFEAHIQAAIRALITVAAGDPARERELAAQVSAILTRYALTLGEMSNDVPEHARSQMERAIAVSQNASGVTEGRVEFTGVVGSITATAWVVDGRSVAITPQTEIKGEIVVGDLVEVDATLEEDGSLTAREIEPAPLPGNDNANQNSNGNENANGNDNANGNENGSNTNDDDDQGNDNLNGNENANANDNGNANGNTNGNTNDNGNDNSNDNANENGNANDNTNGNANENSNTNDNANENGNTNGNTNDNTNDNANDNSNGNANDNSNTNSNDNANTNSNDNQNTNTNTNDNGNTNSNDNQNTNDNGNTNSNDNSNSNSNDNQNTNTNDNSGGNDNTNVNSNDNSNG